MDRNTVPSTGAVTWGYFSSNLSLMLIIRNQAKIENVELVGTW